MPQNPNYPKGYESREKRIELAKLRNEAVEDIYYQAYEEVSRGNASFPDLQKDFENLSQLFNNADESLEVGAKLPPGESLKDIERLAAEFKAKYSPKKN